MTRKTVYHLNARAPFGCQTQMQTQMQMTDFSPTTYCLLPTAYRQQSTANSLPPTVYRLRKPDSDADDRF